MAMEGIDIAVLFPTIGLSFMARDNMDPQFSPDLPRLQRLAPRFRAVQPGPAEDGGDAAGARRQPGLRRAASLRQGVWRGRAFVRAQLRQRRYGTRITGPALQPAGRS